MSSVQFCPPFAHGTRQTLASYLSMHTVPETTASTAHFFSGLAVMSEWAANTIASDTVQAVNQPRKRR